LTTSQTVDSLRQDLLDLLWGIDGVAQDPRWHPEGDALYHSLQVYQHARQATADGELWAAALLHDVGKGLDGDHEVEGTLLLDGLMPERVLWLVRHHLDLLRDPARTRRKLRGTAQLRDLEALRRWDLAGRDPRATVCSVREAVDHIVEVAVPVRR
jgi:HD domain